MKTTFNYVKAINFVLGKCITPKEFTTEEISRIYNLKKNLDKITKNFDELFIEIMNIYNVSNDNGMYKWLDHPDEKEINLKVDSLYNTEVTIDSNFLMEKSVIILSQGLSINEMMALMDLLKIN